MVSCESKSGMVIAGRGARACDMCGKERAKWYCAADEAYLCDKCDGSVHSANSVARRHERVKLGPNGAPVKLKPSHSSHTKKPKTVQLSSLQHIPCISTTKNDNSDDNTTHQVPSKVNLVVDSHKGFRTGSRKRLRTPRCKSLSTITSRLTQEVSNNTSKSSFIKEENEDSILLYDLLTADDDQFCMNLNVKPEHADPFSQCPSSSILTTKDVTLDIKAEETDSAHEVPTYEPLLQDLIGMVDDDGDFMDKILPPSSEISLLDDVNHHSSDGSKNEGVSVQTCKDSCNNMSSEDNSFQACEFVEGSCSMVEDGSHSVNDGSDIDTFDVMDLCSDGNFEDDGNGEIKFEDGLANMDSWVVYGGDQSACTSIFDGNPFKGKGDREFEIKIEGLPDGDVPDTEHSDLSFQQSAFKRSLSLRLDYEDVLNAWSDRGSLWTDGQRPQIVPDVCVLGHGNVEHCGGMIMIGDSSSNCSGSQAGQVPLLVIDTGREARVLRYREKRRTRLFSKKIRYEVRKLNAERRPRMKGRFVKRSAIDCM